MTDLRALLELVSFVAELPVRDSLTMSEVADVVAQACDRLGKLSPLELDRLVGALGDVRMIAVAYLRSVGAPWTTITSQLAMSEQALFKAYKRRGAALGLPDLADIRTIGVAEEVLRSTGR